MAKTNYERNKQAMKNYQEKLKKTHKRFEISLPIPKFLEFKEICKNNGVMPITKTRELILNYIKKNNTGKTP